MPGSDSNSQQLRPSTRLQRTEFLATDVGNKHIVMNVEKGIYIGLDEVGRSIWQRLEEPQTISSLCEKLQDVYEVSDRERFERDVLEFIEKLRLNGLVEPTP
jgi:hypothetical protein